MERIYKILILAIKLHSTFVGNLMTEEITGSFFRFCRVCSKIAKPRGRNKMADK